MQMQINLLPAFNAFLWRPLLLSIAHSITNSRSQIPSSNFKQSDHRRTGHSGGTKALRIFIRRISISQFQFHINNSNSMWFQCEFQCEFKCDSQFFELFIFLFDRREIFFDLYHLESILIASNNKKEFKKWWWIKRLTNNDATND